MIVFLTGGNSNSTALYELLLLFTSVSCKFDTNAIKLVTLTEGFKFFELLKLLSEVLLLLPLLLPEEHMLLILSELLFLLFFDIFISFLYKNGSSLKPFSFLRFEISFSNLDII